MASTTFDVEINRVPYTMSFCVPYEMLDQIRSGDRILLDQNQDKPLKVLVQEKLKFFATQGSYKGKNAIQITDLINPPQRFTDLLDQVPEETVQDS